MHLVPRWRQIQTKTFRNWRALALFLQLPEELQQQVLPHPRFALQVPLRLAQKMAKGTLDDPILRQFVPLREELSQFPGESPDPVGDCSVQRTPRLLVKYAERVLLMPTSSCAMHCRYCFRKEFPYETTPRSLDPELADIQSDTSIREVILSGGDPLSLGNQALSDLLEQIAAISHVRRIRFHTRFPVGIPERIDQELLTLFGACPKQILFLLHVNHSRELDGDVVESMRAIRRLGIPVLTQTVLLKGVNDSVETLEELFRNLVDVGILPYYLHQLDRVEGSHHFEVPEAAGVAFIAELRRRLPGYAIPQYVREVAGEPHKTPLTPQLG